MTPYEKIRNHRNQVLYKGDVPLVFGCEVKRKYGWGNSFEEKLIFVRDSGNYEQGDSFLVKNKIEPRFLKASEEGVTILGTPVTLQQVLWMLEAEHMATYSILVTGELMELVETFDDDTSQWQPLGIHFDLTRPVEHQSPGTLEVLTKLLNL